MQVGKRKISRFPVNFINSASVAGKSYMKKINETRREIKKLGADAMVVTSLDEIAWLLNIRGRDIPFSPFVRSYLILDMHYVWLYVNSSQLTAKNVLRHLHSESPFYIMPNSIMYVIKSLTEFDLRLIVELV